MKPGVDIEKLRVALRRMSRGNLLIVAERAIEIVREELQKNPIKWPKRPAYPNYHKKAEAKR